MAAASGESMAETRTRLDASMLQLNPDMVYADVWTADPVRRALNAPLTIDYSGIALASERPTNGCNRFSRSYPADIDQELWPVVTATTTSTIRYRRASI